MTILHQIIDFITQGGIISWVITSLYFIIMTIVIERAIYFMQTNCNFSKIKAILEEVDSTKTLNIKNNQYIKKHEKSSTVRIVFHYLEIKNYSQKAFSESLERKAFMLFAEMEKHVWIIAQIGNIAPLLGLLGTVIGLIEAFRIMAELGSSADVSSFASGIWVAMITTALGLIVAIPSVFIHKFFERIIEKRGNQMTYVVSKLNEVFTSEENSHLPTSPNAKIDKQQKENNYETV